MRFRFEVIFLRRGFTDGFKPLHTVDRIKNVLLQIVFPTPTVVVLGRSVPTVWVPRVARPLEAPQKRLALICAIVVPAVAAPGILRQS